jgi:hypothetical protein
VARSATVVVAGLAVAPVAPRSTTAVAVAVAGTGVTAEQAQKDPLAVLQPAPAMLPAAAVMVPALVVVAQAATAAVVVEAATAVVVALPTASAHPAPRVVRTPRQAHRVTRQRPLLLAQTALFVQPAHRVSTM